MAGKLDANALHKEGSAVSLRHLEWRRGQKEDDTDVGRKQGGEISVGLQGR